MRLPLRVAHAIRSRLLIAPRAHVLVALSGGPDSVALLHCLVELAAKRDLAFQLSAAHLNHGIRGKAADADARFCEKLCAKLKIPLVVAYADTPSVARELKRSLEETARILRHAFLAEAAERLGCGSVAVGHHADDRIETVLFRLCRGTGIAGLQGIGWTGPVRLSGEPEVAARIQWRGGVAPAGQTPPTPPFQGGENVPPPTPCKAVEGAHSPPLKKGGLGGSDGRGQTILAREQLSPQSSVLRPIVVRPLLDCSRAEVLAYLKSKRQRFCTDETNFDTGIPRNALRKLVLPLLEAKVHRGTRAALWRLAEDAETQAAARTWRREWLRAFADCGASGTLLLPAPDELPLPEISELSDVLEVLRQTWNITGTNFTVRHAQALQKLFLARSGPKVLHFPAGIVAERRGKYVTLRRES